MILTCANVWTQVVVDDASELEWLHDFLSVPDDTYNPRRSVDRYFTEPKMLSVLGHGAFPTGLVPLVILHARTAGMKVAVNDHRTAPAGVDPDADLSWLRDYQLKAVQAVVRRHGRGIIKAPTGSGKTECAIALSRVYPCEWLFVVDRSTVMKQTAERYTLRTGETAGAWEGGKIGWRKGSCNFNVATFQGLATAIRNERKKGVNTASGSVHDFLDAMEGVNVDEVHAQPAPTFWQVSMNLPNARYRVGQSGTPLDISPINRLRAMGALGPMIYEISSKTLIDAKVLAPASIRMVEFIHDASALRQLDWKGVQRSAIVRNKKRTSMLLRMAEVAPKPALFFVDSIEHGEAIKAALREMGLVVEFMFGKFDDIRRERAVRQLAEGKLDIIVCNVIFQSGLDIPSLRSVIVGGGGKSVVATKQRIGRGMRRDEASGKTAFEVWDVLDRSQRWLRDHASTRWESYQGEGHSCQRFSLLSDAIRDAQSTP